MAKRLAKFRADLHPRGRHGRFVNTPDKPKLSKRELRKAKVYNTEDGTPDQRSILWNKLNRQQQERLLAVLGAKKAEAAKPKPSNDILKRARVYGTDAEARKLVLSQMSKAQLERLYKAITDTEVRKQAEAKLEATNAPTKPTKPKKQKRSLEEIEAEKQRKTAEKAQKEADAAKQDVLARKKVADLLKKIELLHKYFVV